MTLSLCKHSMGFFVLSIGEVPRTLPLRSCSGLVPHPYAFAVDCPSHEGHGCSHRYGQAREGAPGRTVGIARLQHRAEERRSQEETNDDGGEGDAAQEPRLAHATSLGACDEVDADPAMG